MSCTSREAGRAVLTWLRERDEEIMIKTFDENLVPRFGLDALKSHVDQTKSKHHHSIAHDLVKQGKRRVLAHLVENYAWGINGQRSSDLNTPLHLALWQNQTDIAERLLQMRADANIQNKYGEDANAIRSKHKPIRARLQGTLRADILQLVDTELEAFDSVDIVTAYYNVAKMSADYNAEFSDWSNAALRDLGANGSFRKLADACTRVLCQISDTGSGSLWATMLRGLAMLPDKVVVEALVRWVEGTGLPLHGWNGEVLQEVAWGIAKLEGGSRLWDVCYESLGTQLSHHICQMQDRHISATVWAFAKAGARVDRCPLRHPVLFQAVANFVEEQGDSITSPQSASIIAWAFAKLKERHPRAFSKLARVASRLMDSFDDQNVANTAWSFARLGLSEESLFCELMRRADSTLYEDRYVQHVRMSSHVKLIHWFQIYEAYCFCGHRCPAAIASLSRRLATDLQRIDVQDRREGLSESSGLESVESLRQLDAMISELEDADASADDGGTSQVVPADSLEAMFAATPQAQSQVVIVILKFSRSPECFRVALLEGPKLQPCRDTLAAAGLQAKLPSGAKIFVRPEHYAAVHARIISDGMQLYTSHVLVAREFEATVFEALAALPSSAQVRARQRDRVPVPWDALGRGWNIRVSRTFVHVDEPNSMYSEESTHPARSA